MCNNLISLIPAELKEGQEIISMTKLEQKFSLITDQLKPKFVKIPFEFNKKNKNYNYNFFLSAKVLIIVVTEKRSSSCSNRNILCR